MIPPVDLCPGSTLKDRISEIDVFGTLLLVGVYLSLLIGILFGGVVYSWNDGRIIALFVVSGVLVGAFSGQQSLSILKNPRARAFPLDFFRDFPLTALFVLECCSSTLMYIPVHFIPLYLQFVRQDSAITSGVKLLPLVIFLVPAIVVNGFAVTATGRYVPWFFMGGVLSIIGAALLFTVGVNKTDVGLYGYSILIRTGAGCYLQLPFSVVQGLVSPELIPKAIGFVTFAQLGALSVVNGIFLNESSRNIATAMPSLSTTQILSILSGVGSQYYSGLSQANQVTILVNIVAGLNKGYVVCITAAGLSIILSVCLGMLRKAT